MKNKDSMYDGGKRRRKHVQEKIKEMSNKMGDALDVREKRRFKKMK